MMKCSAVTDRLQRYWHRELSPADEREVDEHLRTCETCREFASWFETEMRDVRESKRAARLEPGFAGRIVARVTRTQRPVLPSRRSRWIGAAAGIGLAALVLFALWIAQDRPAGPTLRSGHLLSRFDRGAWELRARTGASVPSERELVVPAGTPTEIAVTDDVTLRSDGRARFALGAQAVRADAGALTLSSRRVLADPRSADERAFWAVIADTGATVRLVEAATVRIHAPLPFEKALGSSATLAVVEGEAELLAGGERVVLEAGFRAVLSTTSGRIVRIEPVLDDSVGQPPSVPALPQPDARRLGVTQLLVSTGGGDPEVRAAAIRTLALVDSAVAARHLRDLLESEREDPQIRVLALDALVAHVLEGRPAADLTPSALVALARLEDPELINLAQRARWAATVAFPDTPEVIELNEGLDSTSRRASALGPTSEPLETEQALVRAAWESLRDGEGSVPLGEEVVKACVAFHVDAVKYVLYMLTKVRPEEAGSLLFDVATQDRPSDSEIRAYAARLSSQLPLTEEEAQALHETCLYELDRILREDRDDPGIPHVLGALVVLGSHDVYREVGWQGEDSILLSMVRGRGEFADRHRASAAGALVGLIQSGSIDRRSVIGAVLSSLRGETDPDVAINLARLVVDTERPAREDASVVIQELGRILAALTDPEFELEGRASLVTTVLSVLIRCATWFPPQSMPDELAVVVEPVRVLAENRGAPTRIRIRAIELLGVVPPCVPALPHLERLVLDPDESVASTAIRAIANRVRSVGDEAHRSLERLSLRPDAVGRMVVLDGLWPWWLRGESGGEEQLERWFRSDDRDLRESLCDLLLHSILRDDLRAEAASRRLRMASEEDPDPGVRLIAHTALLLTEGEERSVDSARDLLRLLRDEELHSRTCLRAVELVRSSDRISMLPAPELREAIERILSDHDDAELMAEALQLAMKGRVELESTLLREVARDASLWWVRAMASASLAERGELTNDRIRAVRILRRGPVHLIERVRREGLVLSDLEKDSHPDPTVWTKIKKLLLRAHYVAFDPHKKNEDLAPRPASSYDLVDFFERWHGVHEILSILAGSEAPELRLAISGELERLGRTLATRLAPRLLSDEDPRVREDAARWMAMISDERAATDTWSSPRFESGKHWEARWRERARPIDDPIRRSREMLLSVEAAR